MTDVIVPKSASAEDLKLDNEFKSDLELPIAKGDVIGKQYISVDGRLVGTTDLVSTEDVRSYLLYIIGAIAAAALIFIAAVAIMMKTSKNRRKKRRNKRLFS